MKKLIGITVIIFSLIASSFALAATNISVLVNNKLINFPDQKPILDSKNRTLVPVRFVSEALGAAVDWEGQTEIVTIKHRQNTIKLKIGESKATVNGQVKTFDTQAMLKNSRTMVPLRFISETLGAQVVWIAKTSTVKVTVDNGYTIPRDTEVVYDIPKTNDNPHKVDITISITIGKALEPQFTDLYKILYSKFGMGPAKEITEYARLKKDRWSDVPTKWWTFNNQLIFVGSRSGGHFVEITVWQPGVTKE